MNNYHAHVPVLIIGTGIAGISVLKEIREIDAKVPVLVIDENDGYTYLKPMLSKFCQSGFNESILNIIPSDKIEETYNCRVLKNTRVVYVDTERKNVTLDNQEVIRFSYLVLATGAVPRRTSYNKNEQNIHVKSISSWKDYASLVSELTPKTRIAIIGAGIVGCEVAYDLSHRFDSISLITPKENVLSNLNDIALSEEVKSRLLLQKIKIFSNVKNISYKNTYSTFITFEDNNEEINLEVELIIECVGNDASISIINGRHLNNVTVNDRCQTEFNNVYALGDCASFHGNIYSNIVIIKKCAKTIAENIFNIPSKFNQNDYNVILKVGSPILKTTVIIKKDRNEQ